MSRLTEYYVWIAVGGALGGLFNVLAAPQLFVETLEYPLALVLACWPDRSKVSINSPSPQTVITSEESIHGGSRAAAACRGTRTIASGTPNRDPPP